MRSHVLATTAFIAGLTLAPLGAQAGSGSLYGEYLKGLEARINGFADFGFTVTEISEIQQSVRSRPQIVDDDAAKPYFEMFGRLVDKFRDFGFDRNEKAVLEAVVDAAPRDGVPARADGYQALTGLMDRAIDGMRDFGFDANELDVLKMMARAGKGSVRVQRHDYDTCYRTWQPLVSKWETAFADFGLDEKEKQVLALLRSLQPQIGGRDDFLRPPPIEQVPNQYPNRFPNQGPASGVVRICGTSFNAALYTVTTRDRALILDRSGELSELDRGSCRIRFLADDVNSFELVGRYGVLAFRDHGGAYHVNAEGDVFVLPFGEWDDDDEDESWTRGNRRSQRQEQVIAGAAKRVMGSGRAEGALYRYHTEWRRL
jgi:hypothetical protein